MQPAQLRNGVDKVLGDSGAGGNGHTRVPSLDQPPAGIDAVDISVTRPEIDVIARYSRGTQHGASNGKSPVHLHCLQIKTPEGTTRFLADFFRCVHVVAGAHADVQLAACNGRRTEDRHPGLDAV